MGTLGERRDATPGLMKPIHHRMPVILNPDDYFLWLDSTRPDLPKLTSFLKAYPASSLVNNPRNDTSLCIQPL
jgi:putative SOS response-associated peptidase YedK